MIIDRINSTADFRINEVNSKSSTIKALKEYKNEIIRNQEISKIKMQEEIVFKSDEGIVKRKIKR